MTESVIKAQLNSTFCKEAQLNSTSCEETQLAFNQSLLEMTLKINK